MVTDHKACWEEFREMCKKNLNPIVVGKYSIEIDKIHNILEQIERKHTEPEVYVILMEGYGDPLEVSIGVRNSINIGSGHGGDSMYTSINPDNAEEVCDAIMKCKSRIEGGK